MNLPNKLTIMRAVLIPFFLVALLGDKGNSLDVGLIPYGNWIALAIFAIASLTDMLDGKIARKYNLVTNFGKFMDPLADKLLVTSALIALIQMGRIESWIVIVIVAREFIISGYRLVAAEKGTVIAAGIWGKVKTAVTMVMLCVMIADFGRLCGANDSLAVVNLIETILVYVSLVLTIVSLIDYLIHNKGVLSDIK